jgi:hypothetical protein
MKSKALLALLLLLCMCLACCAPGTNSLVDTPRETGPKTAEAPKAAGFWFGLWHGIISPVTFVISLFSRGTQIYEVHNSGGWYDFGFLLGISMIFGGGGGGAARARRRS